MSQETNTESGPQSDIDVPVSEHIEEMVARILLVASVGFSIGLLTLPISDDIILYLWESHIPNPDVNSPRLYSPLSLVLTRFKIILLAALTVSLPVLIYHSYKFMRPGMFEKEELYFKISSGVSVMLSLISIIVSHFIVIPLLFFYFSGYTDGVAELAFGLLETVGLMIIIMIYLVIIFQIPVLITLAVISGVVSIKWIESKRLVFWGSFFGIAFLATPDPTGTAPIIITVIMLVLFESTLFVLNRIPNLETNMRNVD